MAVPKRRTSIQKKHSRRAHDSIKKPNLVPCPNCGYFTLSHRVCKNCGHYKGTLVLEKNMLNRDQRLKEKKEKRQQQT